MEPEVRLRHAKLLELLLEPGLRPHDAAIGGEQVHHVRVNLKREIAREKGIWINAHPLDSMRVGLVKPTKGESSLWLSIPGQSTMIVEEMCNSATV